MNPDNKMDIVTRFIKNYIHLNSPLLKVLSFKKSRYNPALDTLTLKAKTRQEVANEYGISLKTLSLRLKKAKIKIPPGRLFPKTLRIIYSKFGMPSGLKNT